MELDWRVIEGREKAVEARSRLFELFEACFKRPFPEPVWKRLYLDNPLGEPVSSAGFSGDRMLAHHALIPQLLEDESGERLSYWLFISLMVHPEARGLGTFRRLCRLGHEYSQNSSRDLIIGFPNQNSYMPLKRAMGWGDVIHSELLDWSRPLSDPGPEPVPLESWRLGAGWNIPSDPAFLPWRCSHGDYRGLSLPDLDLLVKPVGTTLNLLDVEVGGPQAWHSLRGLMAREGWSKLTLTRRHAEQLEIPVEELEDHGGYTLRMCMATPKVELDLSKFRLNLLLTDTF